VRAKAGASATLQLLLEATPVPPGFANGELVDDVDSDAIIEAFERMSDARAAIIDAVQGDWTVEDAVDVALLIELNERDQLWRRALNEALSRMTSAQLAAELRSCDDE
jgi:hypothetical protein